MKKQRQQQQQPIPPQTRIKKTHMQSTDVYRDPPRERAEGVESDFADGLDLTVECQLGGVSWTFEDDPMPPAVGEAGSGFDTWPLRVLAVAEHDAEDDAAFGEEKRDVFVHPEEQVEVVVGLLLLEITEELLHGVNEGFFTLGIF